MTGIIDYIWYRTYRGSLKSGLKRPRYLLASLILATSLHVNIIGLSYTFFFFWDIPFIYENTPDQLINVVTVVFSFLMFLLYRKRGHHVYIKYRKETHNHKIICTILTAIYFILTIIAASFGGVILRWIKYGYFPL